MKEYSRKYPSFALCGLNCGLCPRFHTDGDSRCPGCGGDGFNCKRGTCSIVTCSQKHNNVEFCFQCDAYPCEKYINRDQIGDSFITYKNVLRDLEKARTFGIEYYKSELDEKIYILRYFIENFNDGRKKNFYCLAVNLLELTDLKDILISIKRTAISKNIPHKEKIKNVVTLIETKAREKNIILKLRKQKDKKPGQSKHE